MFTMALQGLSTIANRIRLHSPELLLAAGVVGVVGSTVLACKATLKADDILDEHKENMEKIHEAAEKAPERYSEHDVKADTTRTYIATAMSFVKAYAPAVIVGVLSIAAIISSHSIMRQRNLALTAALSSANAMFTEYRERVRKQLGEDVDDMIFNGGHEVVSTSEVTDLETGKTKKYKEKKVEYTDRPLDPYARLFGEEEFETVDENGKRRLTTWKNVQWDNQTWLTQHELWLNQQLKWREFKTLYEVYEDLGFTVNPDDPRFEEYRNMGWEKDDYIDLGLHSKRSKDFMDGVVNDVWLTFNCHPFGMKKRKNGKYIATV